MSNKMINLTNWLRPAKGVAREFGVQKEDITFKVAFMLPSHSLIDVKMAMANGLINKSTKMIVAERDHESMIKIKSHLKKNFKKSIFFEGELCEMPLAKLMKDNNFNKIDYAFMDLCGHLNAHLTGWLYDNRDCFSDYCRYGITVTAAKRIKTWEKVIQKGITDTQYVENLEYLIADSRNNLSKGIYGAPIDVDKDKQNIRKKTALYAVNVIKSIKGSCYAFITAFNSKNISINRIYRYKDIANDGRSCEMVFIDFRFNGKSDGDDFCEDLLKEYDCKVGYNSQVFRYGRTATKKTKTKIDIDADIKTAVDIARYFGIFGKYKSIHDMPKGKFAHLTIKAKRIGLDPEVVKQRIENRLQKYGLQAV